MTELGFPESSEDLDTAFDNAVARGAMQRDPRDRATFFGRFELLASDVQDGVVIADWFLSGHTNEYIHVPRKDDSE